MLHRPPAVRAGASRTGRACPGALAWVVAAGIWVGCAAPRDESSDLPDPEPEEASADAGLVHGSLITRYRGRHQRGGDQDHDLYAVLDLSIGDSQHDAVSGSLLARVAIDLDGAGDDSTFDSLQDTDGGSTDTSLYTAYVDVHSIDALNTFRVGRQFMVEAPEFAWFDGMHLAFEPGGSSLRLGLYGGIPVREYESSSAGDRLAGAYVEGRPWTGARTRLDWLELRDETELVDHENDILGVGVWQSLGASLHLSGEYSRLDAESRDMRFGAAWYPGDEWTLRASYFRLFTTQRDLALEADPFYDSLREYYPFQQASLLVAKDFGDRWALEGGADVRRVIDEDDVGEFNRDFERGFVTASLLEVLPGELTLSVTADVWYADDNETEAFGAELSRALSESGRISLGTDYSLYKYDFFLDSEKENVRTWYLRWRRRARTGVGLDVPYEFEEDDTDQYNTLRVVVSWHF
ncbi:MAG: hypothetical protein V3T24_12930 [Longimicrobiales bacterium]